jgi:O-acetyl-ADP-ribose deacetylase (regulator of RNase III)
LDEATITEVFFQCERDLLLAIRQLSEITGIVPEGCGLEGDTTDDSLQTVVREVTGDLFSSDPTASLGHCVSRDLAMGKGIAVVFKRQFGRVADLKAQRAGIGNVATLADGKRFIYYMITKERYFHKPTYKDLEASLTSVKAHALRHGVRHLCLPRIGCGLDGLLWGKVKSMLVRVFQGSGITITVYTL